MNDKLEIGSVVESLKGRDSGKFFVVVEIKEEYVYISDGMVRPLAKPKRKKMKHVKDSQKVLEVIASKLKNSKIVFDSELKKALRTFNDGQI